MSVHLFYFIFFASWLGFSDLPFIFFVIVYCNVFQNKLDKSSKSPKLTNPLLTYSSYSLLMSPCKWKTLWIVINIFIQIFVIHYSNLLARNFGILIMLFCWIFFFFQNILYSWIVLPFNFCSNKFTSNIQISLVLFPVQHSWLCNSRCYFSFTSGHHQHYMFLNYKQNSNILEVDHECLYKYLNCLYFNIFKSSSHIYQHKHN